jgi:hypothetical protein
MSIESRHGVDDPGYEPTRAEKLDRAGESLRSAGRRTSSAGWSLVRLGCSGFVVLIIAIVVVGALAVKHVGTTVKTAPEGRHATGASELGIGGTATLEGERSGERVEATLAAYKESVSGGEYDQPQQGMRYVAITLRLKNVGSVVYSDSPSNGATILTAEGRQGKTAVLTAGECSEGFAESVRIAPGESQEGCVAFELPERETAARVQWTPSSGYGEQTAEWSLAGTPGEAPREPTGTGVGSGATSCGQELSGSPDTSCPFAREVLKAFVAGYVAKGVPPATIAAYSPVTHHTYSLRCALHYEGTAVECYVGTADVTFPLADAQKYKAEEENTG